MDHSAHNKLVSFIWSIADDCLRDVYVRGKYRDVILQMFVLRRLDCLLEPKKAQVMEEVQFQRDNEFVELDPMGLREASGYVFYNTSDWTLKRLVETASNNRQILEANFKAYLDGFSANVQEIIDKFGLRTGVQKMAEKDVLLEVLEKFTSPYVNLAPFDVPDPEGRKLSALTNLGMGYVFEELIRKFNEENNEEAGEHFTPREVIQLMVHLLFDPFYTATTLSSATDVNMLHDIKDALDAPGVYDWDEVEQFNERYFANAPADQLSPIIDTCAERFASELELGEDEKADYKIKAKQFVKVYAQLACIMPFENVAWEKLHWFLKFLIPKLKIKDKDKDLLDGLLNSIDLSTYGLERKQLKAQIGLDAAKSEMEPQNPNVRGAYGSDKDKSPLDEIVRVFNERFFAGWDATPEEQRVKFINIAQHVMNNPNYQTQVVDNPDEQNRRLAVENLIQEAIGKERKKELDLYRHYAQDPEFKQAFNASIVRLLLDTKDVGKVGQNKEMGNANSLLGLWKGRSTTEELMNDLRGED